jgi:hypothetical protein
LAELGLVGVALLVSFFGLVLGCALRLVIRSRYEARTVAAGAFAAVAAFTVSAAFDWIWQVPALPAAFLLLSAALFAPPAVRGGALGSMSSSVSWLRSFSTGGLLRRFSTVRRFRFDRIVLVRLAAVIVAGACLVAIAIPLATTTSIRRSQAAAATGDPATALSNARAATRLEPGAATPQMQLALVLELQGHRRAALVPAKRAVRDEPHNSSAWLLLARLQAETRHPRASLRAYLRARTLNPKSPLFASRWTTRSPKR